MNNLFEIESFCEEIHKGAILCAGNKDNYNTMTIGWGTIGILWSKKVFVAFVKPCRYTFDFMNKNDYFSISFFDKKYKKEIAYFGTHSGKDADKVKETGLHIIEMHDNKCLTFEEAKQTIICKKIFTQQLSGEFLEEVKRKYYLTEEPHYVYVGEIIE